FIAEPTMKRVFCRSADRVQQLTVAASGPAGEDGLRARILASGILPPGSIEHAWTGAEQRRLYQDEIDSDFTIFDVILGLTAVLAALGFMNTLVVSGLERQKEIALLRAAGVTRRQVFRLFVSDAGMMGACGGLLGILMAVPFSWLVVEGLAPVADLP